MEDSLSTARSDLEDTINEVEIAKKQALVVKKEKSILEEKLHEATVEINQSSTQLKQLEEEVQTLRRPAVRTASTQTDNRREEELMQLMKKFDPKVLQHAFEAELNLERERCAWLEQQLSQTRDTLQTLASNVNKANSDNSLKVSISKQPRFMWSTQSVKGKYARRRNKKGKKKATSKNIHKSLLDVNHVCTPGMKQSVVPVLLRALNAAFGQGKPVPFLPSGASNVVSHSVWANVRVCPVVQRPFAF